MQTATTKQVRNMVRAIVGDKICKGWGSYTWTDKVKREADMRRVAFRIGYGMRVEEREAIAKQVKDMFLLAGYDNEVKVTDSTEQQRAEARVWMRDDSGTYLRIKAKIG